MKSYILASEARFPNAEIVLDHFHIVKALNDVLDGTRKELRREFKQEEDF